MSTQPKPYLTPEQYLEIDRAAERGSEYYAGEIFPREAVSLSHSRIVTNLSAMLHTQLRGRGGEVQGSNLRLRTEARGPYFYPDLMVFCEPAQLEDRRQDTLTDAVVLVEVLSPSTERYDRTFKFENYQRLASIREYLVYGHEQNNQNHGLLRAASRGPRG
jgi:Uma2 family endonuclease